MKVAILSESSADEAGLRILIDGILGSTTEAVALPALRTRGWPSVTQVLPVIIRYLHFHSDADGFALEVDSNGSVVHAAEHDAQPNPADGCRLCRLRRLVSEIQRQLGPRPHLPSLKTAVGLAVPAIEAWYLRGRNPAVSEASWLQGRASGRFPYSVNDLKREVYGTHRPNLQQETAKAIEETTRIVQQGLLPSLVTYFPGGFGPFMADVRSWRPQKTGNP